VIGRLRGPRLWLGRLRVIMAIVAMIVILRRTLAVPVAVLLVLFVWHFFLSGPLGDAIVFCGSVSVGCDLFWT